MTYNHLLPVGTIVTCVYEPQHSDKDSYPIAAVVIKSYSDRNCWSILRGGWNHSGNDKYGMPNASDPDYHSFVIHTPETFPYPELLI